MNTRISTSSCRRLRKRDLRKVFVMRKNEPTTAENLSEKCRAHPQETKQHRSCNMKSSPPKESPVGVPGETNDLSNIPWRSRGFHIPASVLPSHIYGTHVYLIILTEENAIQDILKHFETRLISWNATYKILVVVHKNQDLSNLPLTFQLPSSQATYMVRTCISSSRKKTPSRTYQNTCFKTQAYQLEYYI